MHDVRSVTSQAHDARWECLLHPVLIWSVCIRSTRQTGPQNRTLPSYFLQLTDSRCLFRVINKSQGERLTLTIQLEFTMIIRGITKKIPSPYSFSSLSSPTKTSRREPGADGNETYAERKLILRTLKLEKVIDNLSPVIQWRNKTVLLWSSGTWTSHWRKKNFRHFAWNNISWPFHDTDWSIIGETIWGTRMYPMDCGTAWESSLCALTFICYSSYFIWIVFLQQVLVIELCDHFLE